MEKKIHISSESKKNELKTRPQRRRR